MNKLETKDFVDAEKEAYDSYLSYKSELVSVQGRMADVMDNATDLIQSCDTDGNLLFVNRCWKETLGYGDADVKELNVFDVIHPDSKEHCLRLIENIAERQSAKDEEVSLISRDGRQIFTRANINCQYSAIGTPIGTQAIFRDVTETEVAMQKIEAVENKYKLLVEAANDVIYQGDPHGNLLFINELGVELTGYTKEELNGIHFGVLIREDHKKMVGDFYIEQFKNGTESTYLEFPIVRKDGTERWVGQSVRMLADIREPGKITGSLGVVRDITDKRRTEEQLINSKEQLEKRVTERTKELQEANDHLQKEIARRREIEGSLKESKLEYERLFQNAHDAIIIFTPEDEVVLEVNHRACQLYGISRKDFIGMSLEKITANFPKGKELIERTLGKEDYSHFVIEQKGPHNKKLMLEVNAVPVVYKEQKAILSINRDVTSRHELDKKLEIERRQRTTSLIDGQEIERRRFAKELHDGLGQMLTAAIHHLRKIRRLGKLNKEQSLVLGQTEVMNQSIIEETRRISKNLMPAVLEDFGLSLAIQNMVDSVDGPSTVIRFETKGEVFRLSKKVEVALYRIAQEALNNALKYAEAQEIRINLENKSDQLALTVIDDGKGFDFTKTKSKSNGNNGYANMRERSELIGADFSITSSEETGTAVVITLKKQ